MMPDATPHKGHWSRAVRRGVVWIAIHADGHASPWFGQKIGALAWLARLAGQTGTPTNIGWRIVKFARVDERRKAVA